MTLKVFDHHHSKSRPLLSNSPLILLSNSNFSTSTPTTTTISPINDSHCILNQKRVNDLPSTATKNHHQLYSTLSNQNPFFIKPTNTNTLTQQLSYYYPIIGLPNWNQSNPNSNTIPNGLKKRVIPHLIPTISMNSLNMFPTSSNQSIHNYLDLNSIPSYTNPSSFLTSQEDYDLSSFNQSYQSSPRPETNTISVSNDEINFNEIKVTNNQNQYSTPNKHQIELNEEFLANLNQFVFEAQQLDSTQTDYNPSMYDQSSFNPSDLMNNSSYLKTLNDDQVLQEEEERNSNKRSFEETLEQVHQSPTLKIKKNKFNQYQTENEIQCDILGCQKAYKRVSECRRHKKDIHGIPLPSEVLGKVKRVRRNFTN
ncbi:uncharacterized protein MELLADRAFT_109821 [Melampsora larici-populina 98AG31]|uniref:C2H2-type domain-containing protein n=1 Tax=Melampsora larici-populina (strain 98AG31 / pathotype 3-4-7) TaxID=747676 RepID=F4RXR2_MELLP|nr:uncharacterized protein MELLADRAFT_109821 [Melampsora larici-populina 98AG31]EGG02773.1 hypothetical protein MELLADRAFT_109821 [Melampsora larici-populina 98AG31]